MITNTSFVIKFNSFPGLTGSCCMNNAKPLVDIDKKKNTSSKRPCILLTWVSENPSHEPSILPALLKLKVAIVAMPL